MPGVITENWLNFRIDDHPDNGRDKSAFVSLHRPNRSEPSEHLEPQLRRKIASWRGHDCAWALRTAAGTRTAGRPEVRTDCQHVIRLPEDDDEVSKRVLQRAVRRRGGALLPIPPERMPRCAYATEV
jgi:hypothetical protein